MAAISTQFIEKNTATAITLTASDLLGDTVIFTSDTFITVSNTDAAPHTVTIPVVNSTCECGGANATLSDIVEAIPAGESRTYVLTSHYNDNVAGGVTVNYDDVTGMLVGAYRSA